ncbi:MAG TPA: hypothetical protein VLA88_04810 [Candidatus Saccharimonadales bacterium]|nr:hypothetical protein [Candidatus Saccharimonadales bacterium]
MAETNTPNSSTILKPYLETDRMEVFRVGLVGVIVGLIVPLLALAIANWFIDPIFCRSNQSFSICNSGGIVAYHSAAIIVAMAVIAIFANWGVFRPLPLVIAATIAMWGFKKFVDPLTSGNWVEYYLFSMALTALSYLLFYWLLRLRNFPASIILTAIATALVCWALVA